MQFQFGNFAETTNLNIANGWKSIRKPKLWIWQLQAFPIAIFNMIIISSLWIFYTPAGDQLAEIPFPIPIFGFVLSLLGVLCFHEFIHSLSHPLLGFSQNSVIGFWPSKMLLYAIFNGKLSKTRFVVILIMPIIILSFFPVIMAISLNYYNFWLAYITILNAFVSSGDVLEIISIFRQTPPGIIIKRNGWDYYWKKI